MRRWRSSRPLLERLIDPEIGDLQAERVDPDELVGDPLAQDEIDLGDVRFAAPLMPRARRVQQLLKADGRLGRWRRQFAEADVLDEDVDLIGRGIREERLEYATLVVLGDGGTGQVPL